MKPIHRIFFAMLIFSMTLTLFSPTVFANAAEPPRLIVIVSSPPDDLTLSLKFDDGSEQNGAKLQKVQRAWEAQYNFFNSMLKQTQPSLENVTLVATSCGKTFEYVLSKSMFEKLFNNILTLDFEKQTISDGQTFMRTMTLVSMRVALTLVIEGLIFFAFCYRNKRSWIAFFVINLITQGGLNIALNSSFSDSYLIIALVFYEILIFIVEAIAFAVVVKEHRIRRALLYVLVANFASLLLGGFLISNLPI